MIAIGRLTKRYGNIPAVEGLSFESGARPGRRLPRSQRRMRDHHLADAPGRDLTTHPTQRWCPASSAAAGSTRRAHPKNHHQRTAPPLPRLRRDIMHRMFKELFIDADADDLAAEDDRRRRVRRSRRARPAMITRPAARHRVNRPRP
jgi:hypothetical protein